MSFQEFMSKVRYWDNRFAKWMLGHFYTIFFEFVLVAIFLLYFVNIFKTIDISTQVAAGNITEQLLLQQSTHTLLIIILLILNSFWMLFIFNGMNRLRIILKDISYQLMRQRQNN